MEYFLSFCILTIFTLGMSLGLLMNKPLKGSCGGLNCRCKNGAE